MNSNAFQFLDSIFSGLRIVFKDLSARTILREGVLFHRGTHKKFRTEVPLSQAACLRVERGTETSLSRREM